MRSISRRSLLRGAAVAMGSMVWSACRRITGQTDQPVIIPTLAEAGHIQAEATAQAAVTAPPPETSPALTQSTTQAPVEDSWPSVLRGSDGVLVTSPISHFYETRYRTANPRPEVDRLAWRLSIDGLVENPQTLDWAALQNLTSVTQMRTLECISNPVGGTLIGNTLWRGVRLADVLALAGVRSGAHEALMTAADGYYTSIPLELALHPDSLLVFEMDGQPLPVKHGYPARVLLPGRYGQKQPKWITGIELRADESLGYWEERGWSNEAAVQVNSQIASPDGLSTVSGRQAAEIWGLAFADESGVARIEVSTDGGIRWQEAEIVPGPTTLVWTEWRLVWSVPQVTARTTAQLAVRATSGAGQTQRASTDESGVLRGTFPDGTSDLHRITVTIEP